MESIKTLPAMGMRDFTRRLFLHCPMLVRFQSKVEEHLKGFQQYKAGVPVYGCIILDPTLSFCLLVKGWKGSTWTFPKGKVNEGEDEMHAAAREVYEEVGFDCTPYMRPTDVLRCTMNDHAMNLYIVPGVSQSTIFETKTQKEISDIKWFKVDDLPAVKTSGSHFYLVTPFVRLIQDWINCKRKGKHWHPARGDRSMSHNKREDTPSKKEATPSKKEQTPSKKAKAADATGVAAGGGGGGESGGSREGGMILPSSGGQQQFSEGGGQVQILKRGATTEGIEDDADEADGQDVAVSGQKQSRNDIRAERRRGEKARKGEASAAGSLSPLTELCQGMYLWEFVRELRRSGTRS